MLYTFDAAGRAGAPRPAVLRDVRNRGIYHRGWSAVTKHRTPWVHGRRRACRPSTTTSGSSTTATATTARLATSPPSTRSKLAKLQRLWLIEATKYNVLPMDDRGARALRPGHGRAADPDPRQLAAVLPRDGTAVGEQRGQHQEQVVLGHRRGRRPGPGRSRACSSPRAAGSAAGPSTSRKAGRRSSTTCSASRSSWSEADVTDPRGQPPGAHGVRVRRRRAGQGWGRHPLLRRRAGRRAAASEPPSRWSSPPTRPRTSATSRAPRCSPDYTARTSRFTGKLHWVQLDVGADDDDHLISPEERLRVAMSRQ